MALPVLVAAPAHADGSPCDGINDPTTTDVVATTETGSPFEALQIAEAQEFVQRRTGQVAGTGVGVAVIDSGVPDALTSVVPQVGSELVPVPLGAENNGYVNWSGVGMAGLVNGQPAQDLPVGIAPGARVLDVHAYDVPAGASGDDAQVTFTSDGLVASLRAVLPAVRNNGVRIVLVPQTVVPPEPADRDAIVAAVDDVTQAGAVVVAAAGDRPFEGQPGYDQAGTAPGGVDQGDLFYPAALATSNRRVIAVTSTAGSDGSLNFVVPSSAITVAVPTQDAVSYALTGDPCAITTPSSAVAAAEVAGILALLMTYYDTRGERVDQVVARMVATAAGQGQSDLPDLRAGAGVVQPMDALTRALNPSRSGKLGPDTSQTPDTPPAQLPQARADLLAVTRERLVWWGLVGGMILVVALVLRPVLARRRR